MQNENRHRSSCSGVEFPPNRSRDATWQYVGARVFILFHDHTTSRDCPVASPIHNELTPPWESWQPSSFKVTNKAMVSVGETFASCCSGFGNPRSVRGARRGKNSWSRSLHQYRAATPSLCRLSFIIISVLIDS